jgi:cbb3-type cytochrome oxidase cytochrome c subunit
MQKEGIAIEPQKELVAMIAYLQRLGVDIKKQNNTTN